MARLSAENFSNPSTPQQPRKTSRFKDMLKGAKITRTSLSPGSSHSVESPEPSPRSAEQVGPGFTKVGLHPSDRQPTLGTLSKTKDRKKRKDRKSPGEVLARQEEELKDVTVPHSLDTELAAGCVEPLQAVLERKSQDNVSGAKQPISMKNIQVMEEAKPDELLKRWDEEPKLEEDFAKERGAQELLGETDSAAINDEPPTPVNTPEVAADRSSLKSLKIGPQVKEKDSGIEDLTTQAHPAGVTTTSPSVAPERSTAQASGGVLEPSDDLESASTSNDILDRADEQGTATDAADIDAKSTTSSQSDPPPVIKVGPFPVTSIRRAYHLVLYAILIGAAFIGPRYFCLVIWRMGVFLAVYALVCQQVARYDEEAGQVLLGTIRRNLVLLEDLVLELWTALLEVIAPMIALTLRRVTEEIERLEDNWHAGQYD